MAQGGVVVSASQEKYGSYCHTIARRILDREEDAEECVNDTWLRALPCAIFPPLLFTSSQVRRL